MREAEQDQNWDEIGVPDDRTRLGSMTIDKPTGEGPDDEVEGTQRQKKRPAFERVKSEELFSVVGTVASKLPSSRAWTNATRRAVRSLGSVMQGRIVIFRAIAGCSLDNLNWLFSLPRRGSSSPWSLCA